MSFKTLSLPERDLRVLWHPCSQMKDYETFAPVPIKSARGSIITTERGELIDVISSWWCKSLGHGHPQVLDSVREQMTKFEHVISANTCNETLVELCEELMRICPGYDKAFFADSGSDGVEVAVKMSLQYHAQIGNPQRTRFVSLGNGYHGETLVTLALGDCELYSSPFASLMPKIPKLQNIPYVTGKVREADEAEIEAAWPAIEAQLAPLENELAAIVVEPILQGAGGILFYHPGLLKKLRQWSDERGIHLIADEILSGMGRLGHVRACEIADVLPDFSVFSKGLTAGFTPMSCILTRNDIYEVFYDEYDSGRAFMHSNTYCGNAISAAAACAALKVYREENLFEQVRQKEDRLGELLQTVDDGRGLLKNLRWCGAVAAADIDVAQLNLPDNARFGYGVYQRAMSKGLLLRPLGNTIYFLPPLNCPDEILERAAVLAGEALSEQIASL